MDTSSHSSKKKWNWLIRSKINLKSGRSQFGFTRCQPDSLTAISNKPKSTFNKDLSNKKANSERDSQESATKTKLNESSENKRPLAVSNEFSNRKPLKDISNESSTEKNVHLASSNKNHKSLLNQRDKEGESSENQDKLDSPTRKETLTDGDSVSQKLNKRQSFSHSTSSHDDDTSSTTLKYSSTHTRPSIKKDQLIDKYVSIISNSSTNRKSNDDKSVEKELSNHRKSLSSNESPAKKDLSTEKDSPTEKKKSNRIKRSLSTTRDYKVRNQKKAISSSERDDSSETGNEVFDEFPSHTFSHKFHPREYSESDSREYGIDYHLMDDQVSFFYFLMILDFDKNLQ